MDVSGVSAAKGCPNVFLSPECTQGLLWVQVWYGISDYILQDSSCKMWIACIWGLCACQGCFNLSGIVSCVMPENQMLNAGEIVQDIFGHVNSCPCITTHTMHELYIEYQLVFPHISSCLLNSMMDKVEIV